jgi:hypothetical protein
MEKNTALVLSLLFAGAFLVGGCSTTKFEKYDGSVAPAENVGEVSSVDGIDFWRNGQPDRQYLILGVIEQSHYHRLPLGEASRTFSNSGDREDREEAIAKVAHKNGGNAVIFVAETPESTMDADQSTEESYGHHRHQRFTLLVVKYIKI